jgi:hypothetical protein
VTDCLFGTHGPVLSCRVWGGGYCYCPLAGCRGVQQSLWAAVVVASCGLFFGIRLGPAQAVPRSVTVGHSASLFCPVKLLGAICCSVYTLEDGPVLFRDSLSGINAQAS